MTDKVYHSRRTAFERSVEISLECVCVCGGGGGGGGSGGACPFYVATTLALSSAVVYTTFVHSTWRVPNSLVQHLRENKNQTMKQRWGLDSKTYF